MNENLNKFEYSKTKKPLILCLLLRYDDSRGFEIRNDFEHDPHPVLPTLFWSVYYSQRITLFLPKIAKLIVRIVINFCFFHKKNKVDMFVFML